MGYLQERNKMANQIIKFLKDNTKGIVTGGIVGAVLYFISQNVPAIGLSTLQGGLESTGIIDQLGITLEIKTLLFFIILGIIISLLIRRK